MADQKLILNVDDDWKKQAQEEKRRLSEQEQKAKEVAPPPAPAAPLPGVTAHGETPEAGEGTPFGTLVQTLLTQTLVYLGAMGGRTGRPMLNLDAARTAIDMLGVLDEKTRGNLTPEEQQLLDTALYEARNRFIGVATQMIGP